MLCAECVCVSVYVCQNVGLCNSSFRVLNLVWFGFVLHFPGMLLIPNTWVCVSSKNTETSRISSPNFTAFCEGGESLTTNIYIEFVDISQSSRSFSYRFGLFTIFEIFALFLFFIQFLFCFWTPTIQFSFQFFLHYWLYIMRVCHSVYWFPNNYHSNVCSFYLLLFLLLHFCLNRNTKSLEFTSAYTLSTHSFSQHHTRGVQMYTGISRELKNTHKHKHSYTHTYAALCKSERGLESFCCILTHTLARKHTRIRTIRLIFRCLPNETRRSTYNKPQREWFVPECTSQQWCERDGWKMLLCLMLVPAAYSASTLINGAFTQSKHRA